MILEKSILEKWAVFTDFVKNIVHIFRIHLFSNCWFQTRKKIRDLCGLVGEKFHLFFAGYWNIIIVFRFYILKICVQESCRHRTFKVFNIDIIAFIYVRFVTADKHSATNHIL